MQLCATNKQLNQKSFARWLFRKTHAKNLKSRCSIRIPSEKWRKYRGGKKKRRALALRKVVSFMRHSSKEGLMLSTTRRKTSKILSKREPIGTISLTSLREISIRIWSTRLSKRFTMSRESVEHSIIKGNRISKMHGSNKLLSTIRSALLITYSIELY